MSYTTEVQEISIRHCQKTLFNSVQQGTLFCPTLEHNVRVGYFVIYASVS